jgi:hypothetical protein
VHLDPVGAEDTSGSDLRDFETEEGVGRQHGEIPEPDLEDAPAEGRGRPPREGLPKRFRMRHGRHYVDALLGDAPVRAVREIPISEIEPPPDEPLDLERLEQSIRRLGVIEPILVTRRGLEYRVIAGMRRLRAARTAGLSTVPCLVHDLDDEKLGDMREAATERLAPPAHREPAPQQNTESSSPLPEVASSPSALEEVSLPSGANHVASPGIDEGLRLAVMAELEGVEQLRSKIASAASDILTRAAIVDRAPTSCAALVEDAIAAVEIEARLRGVKLEKVVPPREYTMPLDAARCRLVLTGLLQNLLTLVTGTETTLHVHAHVTTIRPALIVDCALRGDCALPGGAGEPAGEGEHVLEEAVRARFFDAEWSEHPCGESGARTLAALARIARAHGGRVQAHASGVTFVVPRPI